MKKHIAIAILAAGVLLAGCGSSKSYADGTYTGQSDVYINEDAESEEGNGYGVATITISGGVITDCTYETYTEDGVLKDEEYGKKDGAIANKDYYSKAQKAVAACDKYAAALVEAGSLDGVDAISGATINYEEFQQAVGIALESAEQ